MKKVKQTSKLKSVKPSPAWHGVVAFFSFFEDDFAQEQLWKMFKLALTSEEGDDEVKERSNLIFFYEYLKALIEDTSVILEEKRNELHKLKIKL